MVEKFKVLPRASATKGKEETKGDETSKKLSLGRGYLSLETAPLGQSSVYLVVFRNLIGKTLYNASVSAIHSKKRRVEEKAMKLQLKVALLGKDSVTQKPKVDHCVISFSRGEDLKEFEQKFEEAVEKLKEALPSKKAE